MAGQTYYEALSVVLMSAGVRFFGIRFSGVRVFGVGFFGSLFLLLRMGENPTCDPGVLSLASIGYRCHR